VLNDDVKQGLLEQRPAHIIRKMCTESTGLISMRDDAIEKVVRGLTTFDEVIKNTPHTFEMRELNEIMALSE